jgi:cation transport protein ChaC
MEDDLARRFETAQGPTPGADAAWRALTHWTAEQQAASIAQTLHHWDGRSDLWIFAYGSLIWKPECDFLEERKATVYGHHRSLCLWSRINRGTADCPGLVLALDRGGCCHGLVFRVGGCAVASTFDLLWKREMQLGSYRPQWLTAHTHEGAVRALGFVINPASPAYAGRLNDLHILDVLRRANGRCGSSAEYVLNTVSSLRKHGLRDAHLERLARALK